MDTLCIPVKKEDSAFRLQCIDSMASIYAGSDRVFVLDKELMSVPSRGRDVETVYRIACSVWMGRSWTLQEAMLPQTCLFLFSDRVVQPSELLARGWSSTHDTIKVALDDLLGQRRRAHGNFQLDYGGRARDKVGERLKLFVFIWNTLACRSTTQSSDLCLVLASCLDFKLRQLRKFETPEEKIQRMMFSFSLLPCSLFFNDGKRLNPDGITITDWYPR